MSNRVFKPTFKRGGYRVSAIAKQGQIRARNRQLRLEARRSNPIRERPEKKGVDTELALTPIIDTSNTNGSCFTLNLIQAGTGSWNRIGKSVNLVSVRIKGTITWTLAPVATTNDVRVPLMRMILVWDKQPSGAALPAFDTVFGHTTQTGTETTTISDSLKYDNMDRFSILRDCEYTPTMYSIPGGGTTNVATVIQPIDEYIKLKGRKTVFSGQTNPMTITDISTGALYVYFRMVDSLAGSYASINDDTIARLRYTDK